MPTYRPDGLFVGFVGKIRLPVLFTYTYDSAKANLIVNIKNKINQIRSFRNITCFGKMHELTKC